MRLIIAEKPSVARDIARVLGQKKSHNGYIELTNGDYVTWAIGHLVTLANPEEYNPEWKKWTLQDLPIVPENFKLSIGKDTADQFKVVKDLVKTSTNVIMATDSGREGELIGRWILKKCNYKGSIERLWISSMTDESIRKGFSNLQPGTEYENLAAAAEQRAIADWVIGLNATRAYTSKMNTLLTIGRVQSPTLAMVVKREKEIQSFISSPFWELIATFQKENNETYQGKLYWDRDGERQTRFLDAVAANNISEKINRCPGVISSIDQKTETKKPPSFFDLTSLQKLANKKLDMTADQTLKTLQQLYESKFVTYPRTDSSYITEDIACLLPSIINKLRATTWGKYIPDQIPTLTNDKRFTNADKVTDHHAILPTGEIPSSLSKEQQSIYDLLTSYFIASHLPEGKDAKTTIITKVEEHTFHSTGTVIIEQGWRVLFENDRSIDEKESENEQLPAVTENEGVTNKEILVKEGKTQPPKRFNEATLLSAMETAGKEIEDDEQRDIMKKTGGLGTPATRASIIEGLKKREYISLNKKSICPTDKGMSLIDILGDHALTSPELTGEWESLLKKIEQGQHSVEEFKERIESFTKEIISQVHQTEATISFVKEKESSSSVVATCPKCGQGIVAREKFYGCSGYTEGCKFTLPKTYMKVALKKKEVQLLCEGEEILFKNLQGQYGPYDLMINLDADGKIQTQKPTLEQRSLGNCPSCSKPVLPKEKFYGCSGYTDGCKFSFSRTMLGKQITPAQATKIITKGKSDLIKGFQGKSQFDAYLVYNKQENRLTFEFSKK